MLRIPFNVIGPVIVVVCITGAYTVAGKEFDIYLALAFGLLGYLFKKLDYPLAPLVLAMVLGDKAEDAFRQAMISAEGSASIFWSNPLVTTMMLVGFALLSLPLLSLVWRRKPISSALAEQSA
jgi:TctA family transporter